MDDLEFIELHGERLAYRDTGGDGEVLLLLHGMAGSSQTWNYLIPRLAPQYRVLAPDLLGHGRSDKPRTDYSLGAFAAGLRDLLDELGIDRVTLVGQSLGGGVAMQFLYQHPEYCRRLILIGSGGLGPDVGWMLRLLSAPGAEFVLPLLAPKPVVALGDRVRSWLSTSRWASPESEQIWRAYRSLSEAPARSAFLRTLRSVVDYRGQSVSALTRLQLRAEVPTLVIWGDQDPIIPVEHGYAVAQVRPNSTLTVLPGMGHFPHVQAPAEVAAAIDAFLSSDTESVIDPSGERQEPSWDCSLGAPPEGAATQPTTIETSLEDFKECVHIERAVGLLMGLRGCTHTEATRDFAAAVTDTGLAPGALAAAVLSLADEDASVATPQQRLARRQWGHLLAGRGLADDSDANELPDDVRIRYGADNDTVRC